MEEKKDGVISVEAEKIIPMTKGEWKEFQKQMRMEGDYFYMVGNKKYVHYDGEDYLRMEDYRQELDKAREEGAREVLEDMRKMWDNDNLGDAPKYGSAGAGLMKGWIRDDINERLSKLTTK